MRSASGPASWALFSLPLQPLGPAGIKTECWPGRALRSSPAGWEAPLTAIPNGPAPLRPFSFFPGPSQAAGRHPPQALPPPQSHSPSRLPRPPGPRKVRSRPKHAPSPPQHLLNLSCPANPNPLRAVLWPPRWHSREGVSGYSLGTGNSVGAACVSSPDLYQEAA